MTDVWQPIVKALLAREPELYPTEEWDELLDRRIAAAAWAGEAGGGSKMAYALAFKAGLHLWNDSLDASHALSQNVKTATGSFWHGIMHRMEGDYGNAKYWFREVRSHPVYSELLSAAQAYWEREGAELAERIGPESLRSKLLQLVSGKEWDPYLFVDLIERQVTVAHDSAAEAILKRLQGLEMRLLLQYSWEQSGGGTSLDFS